MPSYMYFYFCTVSYYKYVFIWSPFRGINWYSFINLGCERHCESKLSLPQEHDTMAEVKACRLTPNQVNC